MGSIFSKKKEWIEASKWGSIDRVRRLFMETPSLLNCTDDDPMLSLGHENENFGDTALISAARRGHFEVVQYLAAMGADLDIQASDTALTAAASNGYKAIVNYLVSVGADLDFRNAYGRTALIYCIEQIQCSDAVFNLLAAGADPNLQNREGETPLLLAASANRTDLVNVLIIAGADEGLESSKKKTPIECTSCPAIRESLQSITTPHRERRRLWKQNNWLSLTQRWWIRIRTNPILQQCMNPHYD